MLAAIFFISSLLILLTSILRFDNGAVSSFGIPLTAGCYSIFCFIAFGKIQGFIHCEPITTLISQQGYDPSRLSIQVPHLIKLGLIGGVLFNVFTSIWIACKGGIWKYVLTSVVLFCVFGLALGPLIHLNPIYSLFGFCCGFMAAVAWVLGLTYIEFCVIGNIYMPAVTIILSAIFLMKSSLERKGRSTWLLIIFGALQIFGVFVAIWHYWGGFNYAFYQCVMDLKALAQSLGTTYEVVNIYIYVLIIPLILTTDIIVGRCLKRLCR